MVKSINMVIQPYRVKMTLSNGETRMAWANGQEARMTRELATVFFSLVDKYGYADPAPIDSVNWGERFGELKYLKEIGCTRIIVITKVELI